MLKIYLRMKLLTLLPLSLIFLLGSTALAQPKKPVTINMLQGQKTEKDFKLSQIFDGVEFVKLETTNACVLPDPVNYSVGKKYIVAAGYTQIYLFDRKGKFLRTIGTKGEGPGEYLHLDDVLTDPEETYILANDIMRSQLLKYDFQGKLIGSINCKEKLGGIIQKVAIKSSSEIYVLMMDSHLEKKDHGLIRKLNSSLVQLSSWYPFSAQIVKRDKNDIAPSTFYLYNGVLWFRHFPSDTLYVEETGKLVPRYIFPAKKTSVQAPAASFDYNNFVGVMHATEIPGYLVLDATIAPGKFSTLIFNQSTNELFTLKKQQSCGSITKPMQRMINDLNGIQSYSLANKNGHACVALQILDLKKELSELCPRNLKIKNPGSRKELSDLVSKSDEGDNPILQIFHVKQ